jgi:hypothetical protein
MTTSAQKPFPIRHSPAAQQFDAIYPSLRYRDGPEITHKSIAIIFSLHKRRGNPWPIKQLLTAAEGLYSMKLVNFQ